ncbi:MAG: hypothetical protein JKY93_13045 [Gammaproteobacteria bacterium]|nr:hypothetical protein [Gammaproteobacteria bacterium]
MNIVVTKTGNSTNSGVQLVHNIGGPLTIPAPQTNDDNDTDPPPPQKVGRWEFGYRPGDPNMGMTVTVNGAMGLISPCSSLEMTSEISPEGIVEINRWLCTVSSQIAATPQM